MIKYAIYMRMLIESHEILLLSSANEIYATDYNHLNGLISYIIACILFTICFSLPFMAFYFYWKTRNNFNPDNEFYFMEFFSDLRNSKYARLYMSILLFRRVLFVSMIIFLIERPRSFIYSVLVGKWF
jgi:hypothetical protein